MTLPRRSVLRSVAEDRRRVQPGGSDLPVSSWAALDLHRLGHLCPIQGQSKSFEVFHTTVSMLNVNISTSSIKKKRGG